MNGKTGLVLEGGGHRGIYTAGVLDVFLENGIRFDGIIGVSAGAAYGASYISGQKGRAIRYTENYCKDPAYMGLYSYIRTGDLFNADFCYRRLPDELDPFDNETFEHSSTAFFVVCTDVLTGKPVYHQCRSLRNSDMDWLQASASMPLASRIVEIDRQLLLDGGASDSIPEEAFEKLGYTRNIVVLTQEQGYRKRKNRLLPLIRIAMKKYPAFVAAMACRQNIYNAELDRLAEREAVGDVFVIRPTHFLSAGRAEHNPEKIRSTYEQGRSDAEAQLGTVKQFIS
jgi:predicted patatin/cPLA2 family phospholipase